MKTLVLFSIVSLWGGLFQLGIASDSHDHGHEDEHMHDDEHGHGEDGVTQIKADIAHQVGIKTVTAGPKSLHQTITSFGRLSVGPEQTSHVRARFPGVIKSVNVTIGDQVNIGELLAVVESNESLKKYEIRAPISGVVTQRHANTGEMTQEQVLFSIVDFDSLWAELRIFPSQQKNLAIGQSVFIKTAEQRVETTISHLLPTEGHAPYVIARAKINNGANNNLFPGLMIEALIVINEFDTATAVQNEALQFMHGQAGVFIKHDNEYTFAPLQLGRADDRFTEVLLGIDNGAEYVTSNSYLIKADIEKSEAEHVH